jgi:hypothetical protein
MRPAHVFLHFGVGMLLGGLLGLKPLLERWYLRRPLHPGFAWWFAATYFGGFWAIAPSLLRMAGVPEGVRAGWWMNVFVFHPLINQIKPGGGLLIGEVLILGVFAMQYALLVLALVASRRQLRKARNHAPN